MNNTEQAQAFLSVVRYESGTPEIIMIINDCVGGFFPAIMRKDWDEELGDWLWEPSGERGLIYHQKKSRAIREGIEWAKQDNIPTNFIREEHEGCLLRDTCEGCVCLGDKGGCELYKDLD